MSPTNDFGELFVSLKAHGVKVLIVGGYAVAFHAKPRYTKDLDLWVEPSPENAERLLQALEEFGFGALALKVEDFTTPGRIVQLGYPPKRVDLLTSIPGVDFEAAWNSRVEGRFAGQSVAYLGLDDLLTNKATAGRPQDLADVAVLKRFAEGKKS